MVLYTVCRSAQYTVRKLAQYTYCIFLKIPQWGHGSYVYGMYFTVITPVSEDSK